MSARNCIRWVPALLWILNGMGMVFVWAQPIAAAENSGLDRLSRLRVALESIDSERLRGAQGQPGDWVTTGMDLGETHYSPLEQIHDGNVSRLGLAWSLELGTTRGIEATPVVVEGVVYFTTPWSVVHAVDATTGRTLWKWDPKVDKAIYGGRACCDVVNRGVAVYRGRVYVGVLDGRLVALDATSGRVVWERQTVDSTQRYTITGAPRVVEDRIVIGNGGADLGVRGFVAAYDAANGQLAWRTYTVPGNPADGFESKALESAAATWKGTWWEAGGGGTCWDGMAYDPVLKLVYVGTGNGSPWNRRHRSPGGGDNLYLSSILALRADNGEVAWHFQTTPGDTWDYTATQPIVLADLAIGGRLRKVLMQAPKNGFFYVLDRETGEFISGKPFTEITWADGLDSKTGRPVERPGMDYSKEVKLVKPGTWGAHNWHAMAFHPKTKLVYIPAQGFQERFGDDPNWKYTPTTWNMGLQLMGEVPNPVPGSLLAWDPIEQKAVWEVNHRVGWNGGVLATGGNLVFQGTGDGRFVAYHAASGKLLWETPTGTAIIAAPATYSIAGRQYITVIAGWGGSYGLYYPPGGDAARYEQVGRVYTFSLDSKQKMPVFRERKKSIPSWPAAKIPSTPTQIAKGETLFNVHCVLCHGQGGVIPDLRYSSPGTHRIFDLIVRKGIYAASKGMPSFSKTLSESDVTAIQAFVLDESRKLSAPTGK